MGKIVDTRKRYQETLNEITKTEENWLSFLDSSSWNFKYDFADQVLIYTQRPEATACADMETWNKKIKRWINKNADGIFIFSKDEESKFPFKLVFDVSDTHNYKGTNYKLWTVKPEYEQDIIEMLDANFGGETKDNTLIQAINLNVYNMVEDNIQDYLSSINKYKKGSSLENMSEQEIYISAFTAVWASVSYMMMKRCGIDARNVVNINEFSYIKSFNSDKIINILGMATSDIAELGLRQIAKEVYNLQLEEKSQNHTFVKNQNEEYYDKKEINKGGFDYGENNIHESRRLQYTKSSNENGENTRWQIRKNETSLSKNSEKSRIHNIDDEYELDGTLNTNSNASNRDDKNDNREIGNSRGNKRRIEDERPNEVDRINEQLQDDSRGTSDERIDLQLGVWKDRNDTQGIVFIDEDIIVDRIIQNAPKIRAEKDKFVKFLSNNFENNKVVKEFLVNVLGKEYNEFTIEDFRVGYKLYNNGIYFWKGNYLNRTEKCFLDWERFINHCVAYAQVNSINGNLEILSEEEQKEYIADVENTPAFFVPQELIDEDLQKGSNMQNGKYRVYQQFLKGESNQKNAEFLKKEYGIGGYSISNTNLMHDHNSKGIFYKENTTDKKYLLKWTEVAKRIGELISIDRYLSEKEKDEYNDWLDSNDFHSTDNIKRNKDYYIAQQLLEFMKEYDWNAFTLNNINATDEENIELIIADINDISNLNAYINFLKETLEDTNYYDELAVKAKVLIEKLESKRPNYVINVGDTVYIGIDEYEVRTISDERVVLADIKFPLFTKEFGRKEFDKRIKENPANDILRKGEIISDISTDEGKNEDIEAVINMQENIEQSKYEENLKPKIKQQKRRNKIEHFDLHPEIPLKERENYHIKDELLGMGTPKQKFRKNIEAIKVLKKCIEENRYATAEEQEILSQYVGWGGLQDAFDFRKDNWAEEYKELKGLLTEKEFDEARESSMTAFYTPPIVINSIYKALIKMGLERGNILEPSCRYRKFYGNVTRRIKSM